jgi:hypothetical protein
MSVDLDEVTSKAIRGRLEDELDMDLAEYKSFIDQEMLTILGQMDAPTEIFEHVYLGSEWNASNLEELQRNGYVHVDLSPYRFRFIYQYHVKITRIIIIKPSLRSNINKGIIVIST